MKMLKQREVVWSKTALGSKLPLVPIYRKENSKGQACATLNSKIYVVGGLRMVDERNEKIDGWKSYFPIWRFEGTTDFFIFDPCSLTWERGPSPNSGKRNPEVISAGGRIFAFMTFSPNHSYYLESFDPLTMKWKDIEGLPCEEGGGNCVRGYAVDEDGKRIIFSIEGAFASHTYFYRWEDDAWDLAPWFFGVEDEAIILDGFLYNYSAGSLIAIRLAEVGNENCPSMSFVWGLEALGVLPFSGSDDSYTVKLFHMGQRRLFLLWRFPLDDGKSHIYCTRFRVVIGELDPTQKSFYRAVIEFHEAYDVDGGDFQHCVML